VIRPVYLKQLEVGPMANFVYLVGDPETREVVVVDPAWQVDTILKTAESEGLKITGALITHAHYDHCNGLDELLGKLDVPVYVNAEEDAFVRSLGKGQNLFGSFPESSTRKLRSGDTVPAGKVRIEAIHTPGHTPGSQCFLAGGRLLTGDTLFVRGCGRVDLPGGNAKDMYESLTGKIAKLPGDTELYPGHFYGEEPRSKVSEEKAKNPYLLCSSLDVFLGMLGR